MIWRGIKEYILGRYAFGLNERSQALIEANCNKEIIMREKIE